jgi:hypothetical protein
VLRGVRRWLLDKFLTKNQQSNPNETQPPEKRAELWGQELAETMPPTPLRPWKEPGYDAVRQVAVGMALGGVAGCTSLLFNIVGSILWPAISGEVQYPLRIIQVYLTLPLARIRLAVDERFDISPGLSALSGDGNAVRAGLPNSAFLLSAVWWNAGENFDVFTSNPCSFGL